MLQLNHRRIFKFTLKIPSTFTFIQRVSTHRISELEDFWARYIEHKRMPPNVKSQGIFQDLAISLLTLFGTIKPAQLGPPILTPSQEEGLALGRKPTRGPDNLLLQCAPSWGDVQHRDGRGLGRECGAEQSLDPWEHGSVLSPLHHPDS